MPGKSTGRKSRNFGTQTGSEKVVVSAREKGVQVGTYPDLTEKAKVTMQREQRECFPQMSDASTEVYLFVRGKQEYVQRLKNAFVVEKRVVENYGGVYLGIAENLKRYEGDLYSRMPEQCLIMIKFPDSRHAEMWTESSKIFKQKDFPSAGDGLELFSVPVHYLPNADVCAFQLSEMYGLNVSNSEFYENYVKHVPKLMNIRHIYHGVVATYKVSRIRNCMIRPDTYVLLFCADSEKKLTDFYDSAEYQRYREYRQRAVADTNTCFFTLKPLTSR
ncbi:uncharacterized protein LOC123548844 [Mercenaria mercenaria]|uniref:uncharacterized protein LOC123548844 n=1 Tax=Mercenaria mercenaria TaxID=6596 RepID=UPI00234E6B97|nr:uncharacterized protein LOC123548844 [Mercenaria mercenaria]XP_053401933.1 uncharacterized protein LOC123548844 [Mercenaria mercenaria]